VDLGTAESVVGEQLRSSVKDLGAEFLIGLGHAGSRCGVGGVPQAFRRCRGESIREAARRHCSHGPRGGSPSGAATFAVSHRIVSGPTPSGGAGTSSSSSSVPFYAPAATHVPCSLKAHRPALCARKVEVILNDRDVCHTGTVGRYASRPGPPTVLR